MKPFYQQVQAYLQFFIDEKIDLHTYALMNKLPIYGENSQDKGWKGVVIEHILNLPKNNKKGADYENLEIKSVPVSVSRQKVLETTCLSVLKPEDILAQPFHQSDLLRKIEHTLFVLIDMDNKNKPVIHQTIYFNLHAYPDILAQMQVDYDSLATHILDNIQQEWDLDTHFTGKLGQVIQPRPKTGKKGQYTWAFYLKTPVLNQLCFPNIQKKFKP